MTEENWLNNIPKEVIASVLGASGLGLMIGRYLKNKDRKREEKVEAKKAVLKLLPELRIAENQYMRFLSESIYYHELGGDLSIIDSPKPPKQLINLIEASPLHLLKTSFAVRLEGHKATMQLLANELSERQSTLRYSYDHPENIESNAKNFMEKRLASILIDLHLLRKGLTIAYLDKSSWSKDDRRVGRDLKKLRDNAYSVFSLSDRLQALKHWYYLNRFRLDQRVRRWLRT